MKRPVRRRFLLLLTGFYVLSVSYIIDHWKHKRIPRVRVHETQLQCAVWSCWSTAGCDVVVQLLSFFFLINFFLFSTAAKQIGGPSGDCARPTCGHRYLRSLAQTDGLGQQRDAARRCKRQGRSEGGRLFFFSFFF